MFKSWSTSSSSSEGETPTSSHVRKARKKPGVNNLNLIHHAALASRSRPRQHRGEKRHTTLTTMEARKLLDEENGSSNGNGTMSSKVERKSRYISRLMDTAARRQAEVEQVNERRRIEEEQRLAEETGNKFEDKEQFMTSGYKRKLEKDQKIKAQELREEQEDNMQRLKGGMKTFYRRVILGDDGEKEKKSEGMKRKRRSRFSDGQVDVDVDVDVETVDKNDGYRVKEKRVYGLRRNDAKAIAAYRQRYLQRKAIREIEETMMIKEKTPS